MELVIYLQQFAELHIAYSYIFRSVKTTNSRNIRTFLLFLSVSNP